MKCSKCGAENPKDSAFCSNCGEPIVQESSNDSSSSNNFGTLTFMWGGMWMLTDPKVYITLNGENVGNSNYYSFKKGFEFKVPIKSDNAEIKIKMGSLFSPAARLECKFKLGVNYICILSYDNFLGRLRPKLSQI